MLFLIETRRTKNEIEWIRLRLGFEGLFVMDPVGRGDGLALFWNNERRLSIQNFSRRHINATLLTPVDGIEWKFTGFYGHPVIANREES